jgi:hypothetical protein
VTTPETSPDAHKHIVMQTAVRALSDRLPELGDQLVARLWQDANPDERRLFDSPAFRESARSGMRTALGAIATQGMRRPDMRFASRLGRRYAEHGLPLDTALRVYRLAGALLWENMADVITERYPEDLAVLVSGARHTLAMIDQLSGAITESYHDARRGRREAEAERARVTLDALLDGHEQDADRVRSAATELDLPEHARFVVVAVRAHAAPRDEPAGIRLVWRSRQGILLGVVPLGALDLDDLATALRPLVSGPAGIGLPVHGLADLGKARRLAELALSIASAPVPGPSGDDGPGDGAGTATGHSAGDGRIRGNGGEPAPGPAAAERIARLDEHLPSALLAAQPELARHLRENVLGPFLDLDRAERDLLTQTVYAWLDCSGSTARAARRLFCHRNTVLSRLRRVERLTGRRLGDPREATELILAWEAVRLARNSLHDPDRGGR